MLFRDRVDAGRQLAAALASYRGTDAVVLALPRGGVVLGAEVAKALGVPLDLAIARKVGHPFNPEYALCAVTETGEPVCTEADRASINPRWFEQALARARQEAARQHARYLGDRPPLSLEGKVVILVDDGIATGLTMRAAIRDVQDRHPARVVVAVPVIPTETAALLAAEVDRVVALDIPDFFLGAVGAYYEDFAPVPDEEVIRLLRADSVWLFHLAPYTAFADGLEQLTVLQHGAFSSARFPNGEIHLLLQTPVHAEPCLVLGSLTPPDEQLLVSLLLCHTLRTAGAESVTAIFPYLAYMRQDAARQDESWAASWLGALLQASGVTELITVDIHSAQAQAAFPMPITSLSPAALFAAEIEACGLRDATMAAPDHGGVPRAEAVRDALGTAAPVVRIRKQRTAEGVQSTLQDHVGRRVVIIDDILDTGGTLIACCELLRQAGAEEIMVMVTHGLFTGARWQRLWELGVQRIYCTDTIPLPASLLTVPQIVVLSVQPLVATYLTNMYR